MAVNVTGVPWGVDAIEGVILILVTTASVTVIFAAAELMPFNDAVTLVVPTAVPVTTPVVLSILAVAGAAEFQVACVVISAVEPFENVPVAVRLLVIPLATVAEVGVMAMLDNVTGGGEPPPPPQPLSNEIKTAIKIQTSLWLNIFCLCRLSRQTFEGVYF